MNLLIKPASGLCNMRCSYCFYADEMSQRSTETYGIMSQETLEAVTARALQYSESDGFAGFMFQGGEPTLAGIDFYRSLMQYIKKYNTKRLPVSIGLQTNGYAVNEEWAGFFAENDFLIGLSLDGTKDIHNKNRKSAAGDNTFNKVMAAARLLEKYKVRYNTVSVVTSQTSRSVLSIYNFFKKNNMLWQQYIPCLDELCLEKTSECEADSKKAPPLTAEEYGKFLCNLFDLWYADMTHGKYIYNRTFENYVGILMRRPPEECGMCGFCTVQYVLEADGGVYPCDFYVLDQYKLGNFVTDTLESINKKADELRFVEKSKQLHEKCRSCRWVMLCRGGCRRNREPFCGDMPSQNKFCRSYEMFFEHSFDRLLTLARMASSEFNKQPNQ